VTANFDDAAINDVLDRLISYAQASGRFDSVNGHEPKSSPGTGIFCAVWVNQIRPYRESGLSATSGVIIFNQRIYQNFTSQPFDAIDPKVTAAATDLMGALSGDFGLGGIADTRSVDLLGMAGTAMNMLSGYLELDRTMFRIVTVTVPIIINDMFAQVA
jgi:hypothetical protein